MKTIFRLMKVKISDLKVIVIYIFILIRKLTA